MANAINYAEQYQTELDQAVVQNTLTNALETPDVKWMGAKTFHVPNLAVSGYKNHSRNGGFNRGTVDVTHEPYTLQFDRDIEFFVDSMDVDESNFAASAANVTKEFIQRHAGPEIDAYRFSKLATKAIGLGQNVAETLTADDVVTAIRRDIAKVRKFGTANLVAYVSSGVMNLIADYRETKGSISIDNAGTLIETRVTVIDGVTLIEVFDVDRFYSQFDFSDGFEPTSGAKELNWIIVYKGAVVAKVKHSAIYLFEPGTHTQGDGFLYQNRSYHDLFVLKHQAKGLVVSHKA